jgi:hypothetical protein
VRRTAYEGPARSFGPFRGDLGLVPIELLEDFRQQPWPWLGYSDALSTAADVSAFQPFDSE